MQIITSHRDGGDDTRVYNVCRALTDIAWCEEIDATVLFMTFQLYKMLSYVG